MLSKSLSPTYARRCSSALRAFAQPGDGIIALCPRYEPAVVCGLCQRPGIYRCFPIQNVRTEEILLLGIECIQVYRLLAKQLRRGKEHYQDPGTISAILKRYQRRGDLTEAQVQDFLTAGRLPSGSTEQRGQHQSA